MVMVANMIESTLVHEITAQSMVHLPVFLHYEFVTLGAKTLFCMKTCSDSL